MYGQLNLVQTTETRCDWKRGRKTHKHTEKESNWTRDKELLAATQEMQMNDEMNEWTDRSAIWSWWKRERIKERKSDRSAWWETASQTWKERKKSVLKQIQSQKLHRTHCARVHGAVRERVNERQLHAI